MWWDVPICKLYSEKYVVIQTTTYFQLFDINDEKATYLAPDRQDSQTRESNG